MNPIPPPNSNNPPPIIPLTPFQTPSKPPPPHPEASKPIIHQKQAKYQTNFLNSKYVTEEDWVEASRIYVDYRNKLKKGIRDWESTVPEGPLYYDLWCHAYHSLNLERKDLNPLNQAIQAQAQAQALQAQNQSQINPTINNQ